jgi:NAD+ diphosphatase
MIRREHPEGMTGPHPFAIAHHLLGQWLHGDLAAAR